MKLRRPEALSWMAGAVAYAGRGGQAVTRLKYARVTSLADPMAERVAAVAEELEPDRFDLFVPVPIHWVRRCDRGFNQSELLCARLPAEKVRPDVLRRRRHTRPQASLPPERREANLRNAFRADAAVEGRRVVLIDDVVTSGTTARECAEALRRAGAIEIGLIVFALARP
ncbi:MAG: ComF family protein [Fimbriimonadaceae bacterium]|nr:ComF family protein [Fimbriimonadaceae bacterium]